MILDIISSINKSWWMEFRFRSSRSFILAEKLKSPKANLKEQNEELFGNVPVRKNLAFTQVGFRNA